MYDTSSLGVVAPLRMRASPCPMYPRAKVHGTALVLSTFKYKVLEKMKYVTYHTICYPHMYVWKYLWENMHNKIKLLILSSYTVFIEELSCIESIS
jgi:hypothetical protein